MGGNLLVKNLQPFRNGPPRGIRTPDTQVRSLVLYPAELWAAHGAAIIVKSWRSDYCGF